MAQRTRKSRSKLRGDASPDPHQALGASEEKYRVLAENSSVGIWHTTLDPVTLDGITVYVNPAMCRLLEVDDPARLIGLPTLQFFTPESIDRIRRERRKRLRSEASIYEVEMITALGRRRSVLVSGAPLVASDGRIHGTIATFTDISQHKEVEQRLRILFEQSPQGVMLIDPQSHRVVQVNPAALEMLGYSEEEFVRISIEDYEATEDPEQVRAHVARILASGGDEFETRLRTKSGDIRDALISVRKLEIAGTILLHVIIQDITERNRLRDQLLQSQKMEAVGRLAGGVAHDFNNLLAVISGYSESLSRRLAPDDPLREHAEEIRKAAERGGALTRQLLAFSRGEDVPTVPVDLNRIVAGVREMLVPITSRHIRVVIEPGEELWAVRASPTHLGQVIGNLALNARDAMPNGGVLTISTRNLVLDEATATTLGLRPGRCVQLTVADTGVGMDEKTRSRIFEPFFTTKGGQGTGLGLSIVYTIVRQYDGAIQVGSAPDRGSTFEILLPADSEPNGSAGPAA